MSEKRITERILRLPALILIKKFPGISTTEIKEKLVRLFEPVGRDAAIAKNRNDTYFEQKVRNIKSHNSVIEFADYEKDDGWNINDKGKIFLSDNQEIADSIMAVIENTSFTYFDKIDFVDEAINSIFIKKKDVIENTSRKKTRKVLES